MRMMNEAAARSPISLTSKEIMEAESPVKKRIGTVPNPKEAMIRKPHRESSVVAAMMIMDQESIQGKKPVAMPKTILEPIR